MWAVEDIGHQAPENRYDKQIKHADPDEKNPRNVSVGDIGFKQDKEQENVDDKKVIDRRQESVHGIASGHPAENRHHCQHG